VIPFSFFLSFFVDGYPLGQKEVHAADGTYILFIHLFPRGNKQSGDYYKKRAELNKEGPPGGRKKVQIEELHLFVCLFVWCVFLQNVGLFSSLQHEATLEARDSPSY
jgi:hypothetical protein